MIVEFEEKDHIYSVNGDIASISVTELLKKHGLSPNYDGVNKQVLRESAEKGKDVHKDLENVLNEANYEPKTTRVSAVELVLPSAFGGIVYQARLERTWCSL